MELTKQYMEQQPDEQEQYFAYREKKAKEFMKLIENGLGSKLTHRELVNMEFGFKKGMDTITQEGQLVYKGN